MGGVGRLLEGAGGGPGQGRDSEILPFTLQVFRYMCFVLM